MTAGPPPVLIEACVDSVAGAVGAAAAGADRIELCGPGEGGTTPDVDVMRECRKAITVPLHVMIRPPTCQYFRYSDDELARMVDAISEARDCDCDGVVFGVLERSGKIAVAETAMLVKAASGLRTVFHRAFDMVPERAEAAKLLYDLGLDGILTSGGARTAVEGLAGLSELIGLPAERPDIIAAGGIRRTNVRLVVGGSGVTSVHASGTDSSIIAGIRAALEL